MMGYYRREADRFNRDMLLSLSAQQAFQLLGPEAKPAVPELIQLLRNQKRPSSGAATALTGLGTNAIPELLKVLEERGSPDRATIISVFGAMRDVGEYKSKVVPLLAEGISGTNRWIASECARSLGNWAVMPEVSVPALVKGLESSDMMLRRASATSVGNFGASAGPAIPALLQELKGSDGIGSEEAARALGKIGLEPEKVVPALVVFCREQPAHRRYAFEALGAFGPRAKEAVPLVSEGLKDADHMVRDAAEMALRRIEGH